MYHKLCLFSILLFMLSCKAQPTVKNVFFSAAQTEFTYSGRTEMLNDTTVALISSAARVVFNAEGDSVVFLVNVKGDETGYLVVEIDKKYQDRYKVYRDSLNRISILMPSQGTHRIGIYKAVEASNGPLLFYGAEAENITTADAETVAVIEYIGDSITCGFGADTKEIPCDTGTWYDQHNAYLAYGAIAARRLNADYRLISVSGMGIYRNWNDEDVAPVIGDVYATANLDGDTDKMWNFSEAQPDLVSICLGTNDLSDGDGTKERQPFDAEKFTSKYIDLVQEVFTYYPLTRVTLLTSPMISVENNAVLKSCLKEVKVRFAEKHTVEIFAFQPMQPGGCGAHPDLLDHEIMAEQLIPFYADLLER